MFERRLKMILAVLVLITGMLILRAFQIQALQRKYWEQQAKAVLTRPQYIETTRGEIRDRKGRPIALDAPCIDAAVDYRAITETPDAKWVRQIATKNLRNRLGSDYSRIHKSDQWPKLLADETEHVKWEIKDMWATLARVSEKSPDEINDIRQGIVEHVTSLSKTLWLRNIDRAARRSEESSGDFYKQIIGDDNATGDTDKYAVQIDDQVSPHVILEALDPDVQADLARKIDQYPGLSLQPSKHRVYPYGVVACHVLGHMGSVGRREMINNDKFDDELRRYWPNDPIGRGGIEGLCEETLRGARGRTDRVAGTDEIVRSIPAKAGKDVRISIDIDLEAEILNALVKHRTHVVRGTGEVINRENQHGAVVVLDVKTNQVLAMVSNPGFDPNMLDVDYPQLSTDDLNLPLVNRATDLALEPGSSVKTIVGSGSITDGTMTPESTIECTGYLVLNGHRMSGAPRCWVASEYFTQLDGHVAHHPIPFDDPHPTGFLTISDGLERSCNVVFETIADRMGLSRLLYWFNEFGLGRKTGIGISESAGMVPSITPEQSKDYKLRMATWYAGIGQGAVHATPIQMADVAATIARGGIWIRPQLVDSADRSPAPDDSDAVASTQPASTQASSSQPSDQTDHRPDRVDLHIKPEAIEAVREGMVAVVNPLAGTGRGILPQEQDNPIPNDPLKDLTIAGKTGSAQTGILTIPTRDASGKIVRDKDGNALRTRIPLGTAGTETWYIGVGENNEHLAHAWYIGFAPADHPQVAFCVMVEYGGAGGSVAGAVAHDVLEACIHQGYLIPHGKDNYVADNRSVH